MATPTKAEKDAGSDETSLQIVSPSSGFREGGLTGWLTVAGGTMVTFCTFGVVQSYGVYQDYYTRVSLNERTPSAISWIGSVQVFFVFAIGLPAGRLFDAGYFRPCLACGSLLYIFSVFMLSLVKPHCYYQTFLAQAVGMGIGMGLMFLPCLTVTSHFFRRRRSLAMGIVLSGSSLGGCLYPILLNNVFKKSMGFAMGVRAVAFLDLGLLVIANSIMRTRHSLQQLKKENMSSFMDILGDVPYLIFVLGSFLIFWGIFVPFFYLQLYSALHGVSPLLTKYSITIMNASSILGRTIPNFLADFFGALNVYIPLGGISAALIFALFAAKSAEGVAIFGIFYGFFSGGAISIVTPAAASFVTHDDFSDLGTRVGILSFSLAFALLTGNPIAGALLSPPHYKWHRPVLFAAVVTFSGSVFLFTARRALVKRKHRQIL